MEENQVTLKEVLEYNKSHISSQKQANIAEIEDLELSFVTKIEAEKEQYSLLENKQNDLEVQWHAKIEEIHNVHEEEKKKIELFFIDEHEKLSRLILAEKQMAKKMKDKFEQEIKEIEEDIDKEINEFSYSYEKKLKDEKVLLVKVEQENKVMKETHKSFLSEIEGLKKNLQDSFNECKRLLTIIKGLEIEVQAFNNELKQREDTLYDKDVRILDLSKKNQELEKFKFVLEFKIGELMKQIKPRQDEIIRKENQIFVSNNLQ